MLEDPKLHYINLKCHATSLGANIRRKEMVFIVKNLRKRTELLAVDVVKENNMFLCLFHPTLLALTSVFLSEMMLKTMIIVAKIQRTQG